MGGGWSEKKLTKVCEYLACAAGEKEVCFCVFICISCYAPFKLRSPFEFGDSLSTAEIKCLIGQPKEKAPRQEDSVTAIRPASGYPAPRGPCRSICFCFCFFDRQRGAV